MSGASMVAEARRWLGTSGRPNAITRAYAARNGAYYATAPWCDEFVTEVARRSGNFEAACFGTDYAYTLWHAQRFQKAGRWHSGTTASVNEAKPGDIVFFDWGASNDIRAIDHVGIVEVVLGGGRLQTIEGNTDDAVKRRVRGAGVIAGYGRPAYGSGGLPAGEEDDDMLYGLKKGDKGPRVLYLQLTIRSAGQGDALGRFGPNKDGLDSDYGDATAEALRLVRKSMGSRAKQGFGDQVDVWALNQLLDARARHQAKLAR